MRAHQAVQKTLRHVVLLHIAVALDNLTACSVQCTLLPRLGETSQYQTDKKLLYQLISEITSGLTSCEEAGEAGLVHMVTAGEAGAGDITDPGLEATAEAEAGAAGRCLSQT